MTKKILSVIIMILILLAAVSCSDTEKSDDMAYVPYEDTEYSVTRIPLHEPDELMNVRISEEPGEDPFAVPDSACPDPFITYDNMTDYYYGLCTQNRRIELHRSKKLADLFVGSEKYDVYLTGKEVIASMWAPEMYFIDGKWYIYSSGQIDPADGTKRMFVLESETSDPFEGFHFKEYLSKTIFGIDPTLYLDKSQGKNYICFSQVVDGKQCLSMAELTNPWTMENVTVISTPDDYEWEAVSQDINEGPFFVVKNGRLFIIFSANGCYSDYYCLGVLELKGNKLLDKESWAKFDTPIFEQNKEGKIFAPGHASFFYSPDHEELWVAYHCYYTPNTEDGKRRMRVCQVQPVDFDESGFPVPGVPYANGTEIKVPSGE